MKKFVKLFSTLSDETRLRIYLLLLKGKLCVCELVTILNMEQSRISHSLRILKEAELVDNQREGRWIIYSANPKMIKSKIIQGLKKEVMLSITDSKNFDKCKKEKIREKCKIKQSI
ncbi:winged helix-turn-helix transcriptional regulator [Patescibacteria group bacterium]|nr:winged helix-turn-helix transcriptional regulator [Patescibacteria group bacterium]